MCKYNATIFYLNLDVWKRPLINKTVICTSVSTIALYLQPVSHLNRLGQEGTLIVKASFQLAIQGTFNIKAGQKILVPTTQLFTQPLGLKSRGGIPISMDSGHCNFFSSSISVGWFLFRFFNFFVLGIPTSCFILFTGFRTVFVFALGRFVPVVVNFLSP